MTYYDQVGYIPETQGVFHVMKFIRTTGYINRSEREIYLVSYINADENL